MIISQSHRFIFIHIMKAAGTSVTNDLCKHLDWRDLVLGGSPLGEAIHLHYKRHLGIEKHSTAMEAKSVVGDVVWDEYFKFSFVRHPYTRAVSLYNYIARYVEKRRRASWALRLSTWAGRPYRFAESDWLSQLPEAQAYLSSDGFSQFIRQSVELGAQGMRPQVDCLSDHSGALMVDFIGKTEQLKQDLAYVLERVGLPSADPSSDNHTAGGRPWASNFRGEDDFRFLAEVFEKDFEVLGYDPNLR